MPIKILDVGQCGFDGPRMSRLCREKLDATVDRAATEEDRTTISVVNLYVTKKCGRDIAKMNSCPIKSGRQDETRTE